MFGDALALDPSARAEFVADTCAGNAQLKEEVTALLGHHVQAGSFLEPPSVSRALEEHGAGTGGAAPDIEGGILARRYLLKSRLGQGGGGTVYEARDLLRGTTVAVKVLYGIKGLTLKTVRREVAMLRLLRLPGVVQLLDDGHEEDLGFIVMEKVGGAPFPGANRTRNWEELSNTVLALLETLARIHWAGVIHCDLKPANVLVNDQGVPTVLDLGLSAWQEADVRTKEPNLIFGTFRYLAPERLQGDPPNVSSDLFSLGVMLHEALCGDMPYAYQRSAREAYPLSFPAPRPLRTRAPSVPEHVAKLIDRLVTVDPAHRPASAAEAHAILRGERRRRGAQRTLPRFSGSLAVLGALEAVREGRSADIVGPPGSGRTRALDDIYDALKREGRQVVRLEPSDSPLASLAPMLSAVNDAGLGLEEIREIALQQTRDVLSSGTVVVADDADQLDRWSAEVLAQCRDRGAVLRALVQGGADAVSLPPATAEELRELFEGPDRLHHLREDAASELWRRTFGWPAAVAAELEAWERAGLARWENDKIIVRRTDVERLRSGLRTLPPQRLDAKDADLPEELRDLLACIDLAGDDATPKLLERAIGRTRWRIEAELEELERRETIRRDGERIVLLVPTHAGHAWSEERRAEVHGAIASASPEGSQARLYHLLASNRVEAVATEAPAAARALLRAGEVDRALSVLDEGLAALRRFEIRGAEREFLSLMLQAALASSTVAPLDVTLYHLARCEEQFPEREALELITRGALSTLQGDATRALENLANLEPIEDSDLLRCLYSVRVVAGSYCDIERHEQAVQEASAWAAAQPDPDTQSAACDWLGWLRYRQERYEEAAELHARAAALSESVGKAAAGFMNAAWAALEAGRFDDVERLAERARKLAATVRHAHYEARAELMVRSAAYRRGAATEPDVQLVRAIRAVDFGHLLGLAALNEAAVAWRSGQTKVARDLALESARALRDAAVASGELLAEALALACGNEVTAAERETLASSAARCPLPGIAAQTLALLHHTTGLPASWRQRGREIAESIPSEARRHRREVLSIEEALDWLGRD